MPVPMMHPLNETQTDPLEEHEFRNLTDEQILEILEQHGVSHLLVRIRDSGVDRRRLIEQITENQERFGARLKRVLLALVDTIFPG